METMDIAYQRITITAYLYACKFIWFRFRSDNVTAESELRSSYTSTSVSCFAIYEVYIGPVLILCRYIAALTWKNSACQLDVQSQ
jgi:hypothetical protein